MRKKQPKTDDVTIHVDDNNIKLFDSVSKEFTKTDVPEGIVQVTAKQIRFDTPGQSVCGQYIGRTANVSSFDTEKMYSFHEIKLTSGMLIGFCGSIQLDRSLEKVEPYRDDVHIVYTEEKELPGGKSVKLFHVFTRLHTDSPPSESPPKNNKADVPF